MKKIIPLAAFLLLVVYTRAQVNTNLQPLSFALPAYTLSEAAEYTLPDFNILEAQRQDKEDAKNDRVPLFARPVYADITLDNSGNWSELPNGDRVWTVRLTSAGAMALIPYFNQFYLPQGSTLHVYTPGKEEVIGAFTANNNPDDGYYCTGIIHGETCILEYYEPLQVKGQGKVHLNEIGHAYRMVNDYVPAPNNSRDIEVLGFGASNSCEVNVNCTEGNSWTNQKKSISCIVVKNSQGNFFCTGTMVNNVTQDCTPYLLSAQHCGNLSVTSDFNQWLFYFKYESPNCNKPASEGQLASSFMTGCTKIADSNDEGGQKGSDFLLVKLKVQPPPSYQVYFSGWNNENIAPSSGVTIHHPKGDLKKISTYNVTAVSAQYAQRANSHWKVNWVATTNGHGVTEPGSSGAPLFDSQGRVVGQLSGGSSSCAEKDLADYFGKLSYSWTTNGQADVRRLKPWLDPNNTLVTTMSGKNNNCPTAINNEIYIPATSIRVLPNPSSGIFRLQFAERTEKQLYLYDVMGRLVREIKTSDKETTLDLSLNNKGIYLLLVETTCGRTIQKLVLQ